MKFKRILSILLSVAMIVSMCVIPASAAEPFTLELSVTPETVSSTNTIANGSDVTVSVKYKNWPENIDTFKVLLGYDHTKLSATNSNIKPQEVVLQGDEDTPVITKNNNTSTHKINFSLAYVQPSKAAESGTLFTVTFKATTDISEKLDFTFAVDQLYMNSTGVNKPSDAIAPTGISVAAALTGDLPVAITAPVKGGTPETTIIGTNYTGSITWTPTDTGGKFAANTVYTANVTLTAKEGYQFAEDVKPTVAGATGVTSVKVKNSGKTLEFKAAFAKTGTATLKGIDIITNPTLQLAVPTAAPNATATNERSLAVTGVYDDGSGGPVAVNWKITTDPIPKGVSLVGNTLKVTNEAETCNVRVLATSAEGDYTDAETVTITKDVSKETHIVATAPATGTNITIPNGGTATSGGNCSYKVYDQYGAEMTGSHATWKMKLEPATVTGVNLIAANGSISVTSDATACKATLYAEGSGVKSNEITFNIACAASVATSLTIEGSADSVNVPTVTEPGTTSCEYATYTAKVKDQYGAEMTGQTIEWSVTDKPGVTFNNGQLTVTNKADAGTVTITAKSGTLNATKTVAINKAAEKETFVRITAQGGEPPVTTIICTGSQRLEYYTATVYDQYGEEKQDDVKWSLDPATSGVTYEVSATNNNIVTLKVAPNTAAGTFKLVATSQNIAAVKGELEITVQKKNDVSSEIKFNDGSLTYNGAGQKYEKASVTAGEGGTWTYTYAVKSGATGMLDTATGLPKIVGTYTVTATYEDSSNIGSKSATLNITPKTVDIPATDTTVYTYDGTAKTYKIPTSPYYTVSGNIQTNANEAGHIVTVTLTDSTNTIWKGNSTGQKIFMFKIMKATPTGAPSYTKITAAGKTLADADLKTDTITPSGTIKWVEDDGTTVLPDTTPVAKNKAYKWLFTPTDAGNYKTLTGSLTPYSVTSSGGSYVPTVQKPEITIIGSGKADLSADGRTATITANAGHELVSVVLNGKEMGKVEKLTGLKTGDKATITFRAKTDGKAEMDKIIAQKASKLTLMARSKKTAKLNIKVVVKGDLKAITDAGYTVEYKFYRSTKKSAGYKAMKTGKSGIYINTYGKQGTMYYYKARVIIYDKDGNFVAQTALKQCKYANRLWTK